MTKTWPVFIAILLTLPTQPLHAAVVLNEIFPNPVDENDEFIELYNSGDQAVTLNSYKVADLTRVFTITEATVAAKSYYLLKKSDTKIALNNDTETVQLKDSSDATIDSFSYDGTTEGKSYSRIGDGGDWLTGTEPSALAANIAPPNPSPSQSPSPSPTSSTGTSSNQSTFSPSPTPSPTPTPSPSPSPKASKYYIDNINLLTNRPNPETILGTQSGQITPQNNVDWQLIILLLSTGALILIITAIIIIRLCRKS